MTRDQAVIITIGFVLGVFARFTSRQLKDPDPWFDWYQIPAIFESEITSEISNLAPEISDLDIEYCISLGSRIMRVTLLECGLIQDVL